MNTVTLDGKEYRIRCDVNAYEEILEKYGSLSEALKQSENEKENLERLKFVLAVMINEQLYCDGAQERVTEKEVGSKILPGEYAKTVAAVYGCVNAAFTIKN
jgi:cell division protein ZapA (FtsZ GTPase activity inhibitor)